MAFGGILLCVVLILCYAQMFQIKKVESFNESDLYEGCYPYPQFTTDLKPLTLLSGSLTIYYEIKKKQS